MAEQTIPLIKLNDGREIPQLGLGLWEVSDPAKFAASVAAGFADGYRHFDDAEAYGNEQLLGEAWKKSGVGREQIWLTSKIDVRNFDRAAAALDETLQKLGTDYVDLMLLHFPVKDLLRPAWADLEVAKKSGKARSIGVSNYTIKHLEDMKTYAKIKPAVNQVELNVFLQQPELIQYCRDNDIAVEAYSPLSRASQMDNPIIAEIAAKHHKTYAQIMLRWLVQQSLIVLLKSNNPARVRENSQIFDFELDAEDLAKIKTLDENHRECWDPTTSQLAD
ncbi:MAG: aldo/keto reductase [Candidatus Nomurabacteria bacterium]|jgi:diketogulonate reductase-like aldo/keto reductase|nr:aldo/keto reductase [Candidatus Nomurabacteria bacterium]